MYFIKQLKLQNKNPWGGINIKIWGSDKFYHPFFWHWIFGLLNIKFLIKYQKIFNPLIDAIFSALFFAALIYTGKNYNYALLATLLYLFTPMFFSQLSIGPRIASFTPRLFSEIVVNLFFLVLLLNNYFISIYIYIIAFLLSVIILISSKFGIQAMLFISLVSLILSFYYFPFLFLLSSFLLLFIISNGAIFQSLKEQYFHLKNYYKKNKQKQMAVSDRNSLSFFLKDKLNFVSLKSNINKVISQNSYIGVTIKMPLIVFLVVISLINHNNSLLNLNNETFLIVLSSIILFFVINMPNFLFLGEAERYLNHVSLLIIVLFMDLISSLNVLYFSYILILYGFFYYLFELYIFVFKTRSNVLKIAENKIIDYLNNSSNSRVILLYPYHTIGIWRVLLETEHEVIYSPLTKYNGDNSINIFNDNYPFFDLKNLKALKSISRLNTIIFNRFYYEDLDEHIKIELHNWKRMSFPNSHFIIFEI